MFDKHVAQFRGVLICCLRFRGEGFPIFVVRPTGTALTANIFAGAGP